ncbi:MAG: hypothetical protein ABWZ39_11885 [Pseudomonas caspiana]
MIHYLRGSAYSSRECLLEAGAGTILLFYAAAVQWFVANVFKAAGALTVRAAKAAIAMCLA